MNSTIRHLAKRTRSFFVFGASRSGDSIQFSGTGDLYVSTGDNRGRAILDSFGVTQPRVTLLWRILTRHLAPTLILDIGANHGEVALSTRYSREARITLFEPNPALRPFLERSIAAHVNRSQISLSTSLVSDSCMEQHFFVDHKWSGTSSAVGPILDESNSVKGAGKECFEELVMRPVCIDDVVAGKELGEQRLLFKIDVEGFEAKVIAGMTKTLRSVKVFAGITEFDRVLLRRAGTDPREFLSTLENLGVPMILEKGSLKRVGPNSDIPDHTDIVIGSKESRLGALELPTMAKLVFGM
jgi:FkbM family methyltransferase